MRFQMDLRLRRLLLQNLELIVLAVVIGLVGGLGAIVFRWLLFGIGNLFFYHDFSVRFSSPLGHSLGWTVIFLPAIGGLLVGLITHFFAPETRGHGVPEVMEAVAVRGGRIRGRVVVAKALASGLTIGSGGSSGREGPIVQIGSGAASWLSQALRLDAADTRLLVACGATAGITATFNTPIAGVLFGIELILLEFKTRSFVPLVTASVFATIVSRLFLGSEPAFVVPAYAFESTWEIPLYLVLGLIAGVAGILVIRALYGTEDLFDRLPLHPVLKPALGGLLLGALGLGFPQVFGVGYETVSTILGGGVGEAGLALAGFLIVLGVVKIAALSLTLGSGGSGGVFAPSLFIGAAIGGAYGVIVNLVFPGATAPYQAYALVGMAAVFAAASRATFTSIIMLFEMTLDYDIILPLMFACVIADIVAWLVYPHTIYTRKLVERGVRIEQDLEINSLRTRLVRDAMTVEVETVGPDMPLPGLRERIMQTGHQGFPVLDEQGRLVGIVTARDVTAEMLREGGHTVGEVAQSQVVTARPGESLDVAWERMGLYEISHLPVVEAGAPERLVGFLTKGDLIRWRRRGLRISS